MSVDKDYIDAKFDGLEKLIRSEKENTLSYISAVSKNVSDLRLKLELHEKDPESHGTGILARRKGDWLSMAMVAIAVMTLFVDVYTRHR